MALNVELHIEELVLEGVAHSDRYRLAAALERELRRLLVEQGLPGGGHDQPVAARVDGGTVEVQPGMRAEAIGVEIARSVYKGLKQ